MQSLLKTIAAERQVLDDELKGLEAALAREKERCAALEATQADERSARARLQERLLKLKEVRAGRTLWSTSISQI